MADATVGFICIETKDRMMEIGPFVFDSHLSNGFVRDMIHDVLLENGIDNIPCSDVEDIIVVFEDDDFEGIYSPKIEDVWPREFGCKKSNFRSIKKGGEK